MDIDKFKGLAEQLRTPSGADGLLVATQMARANAFIMARAHDALQAQPGHHIIEVGPGNGELSRDLIGQIGADGDYLGIDLSAQMAATASELLRQAGGAKVDIVQGDCMSAELPPGQAHGVTAVNLLYFIDDLPTLFARMHAWLRPGGRLSLGIRSPGAMSALPFDQHGFVIRPLEEILRDLSAAGFEDVVMRFYPEGKTRIGELEMDVDALILTGRKAAQGA